MNRNNALRADRPIVKGGVSLLLLLLLLGSVGGRGASSLALAGYPAAADDSLAVADSPAGAAAAQVTDAAWATVAGGASGEVVVILRDQADARAVARSALGDPHRQVVRALQQTAAASQAPLRAWLDARGAVYRSFYIVNALLVEVDAPLLDALARRPEIARIMGNPQVAMVLPPAEPTVAPLSAAAIPWGVSQVGAPEAWALGYRGQGVVVAGQDTGYQWDHPALQARYRGWDGVTVSHDTNWHDAIHSGGGICGPDSAVPCDDSDHGTHTMGTMVGDDGAGQQIGVAPAAQWIGCRNMSQGVGTPITYAECFEFFIAPYPVGGTPAQGDPDRAPDVINNSWSCPPYEGCDAENIDFLRQVVENVRAAGILVVASAGNRGPTCGTVDQPAGMYDATFTVGATDGSDVIALFSSRGTGTPLMKPDIVAPGVGVYSAVPGGGYGTKSGTSMAAPHIAGAAALLWSARPDLRGQVAATEALLNGTATSMTSTQCGDSAGAIPNNVYGWGRVDAKAAIAQALSGTLAGTVRDVSGTALIGATLQVALNDAYVWTATSDGAGRYTMTPISGTYTLSVTHPVATAQSIPGVVVTTGLTTTLDITLTHIHRFFLPIVFTS